MSMTCTQYIDASASGVTQPIDLRNQLNASITVRMSGAAGALSVEGTDDVVRVQTSKDTGVDYDASWADITAMADSSSSLAAVADNETVVISLFNPPAFVQVVFTRTSGAGQVEVFVTGRS